MAHCKVWKVKEQPEFSWNHPPKGIWFGWCYTCNKRTAQYWSFGAALGATLYHIHIEHKDQPWLPIQTVTSSSLLTPTPLTGPSYSRLRTRMRHLIFGKTTEVTPVSELPSTPEASLRSTQGL